MMHSSIRTFGRNDMGGEKAQLEWAQAGGMPRVARLTRSRAFTPSHGRSETPPSNPHQSVSNQTT